jgi:hypothetical protein
MAKGLNDGPQANDEMVEGYLDGFDFDNPDPSDNRSNSYRHGFANGRADKTGKLAFASAQIARDEAEKAMAKDATL